MEASRSPWSSLSPYNRSQMEAPPSPCHPEEKTCLRPVKGAMNSAGHRALDGCPMFAPAYVGRKSRAKPIQRFWSIKVRLFIGAQPRDLQFYGPFGKWFSAFRSSVPGFPYLTAAGNEHVCDSPKRETQELHQGHKTRQEIRGSVQHPNPRQDEKTGPPRSLHFYSPETVLGRTVKTLMPRARWRRDQQIPPRA